MEEIEFRKEVQISLSVSDMVDAMANASDLEQSYFINQFASVLKNYCGLPLNYDVQILEIAKRLDEKGVDLIKRLYDAVKDK